MLSDSTDAFSLPAADAYAAATSLPLCWRYLCEGAASAVFAYVGAAGPLTATVLRVEKVAASARASSQPPPPPPLFSPPPCAPLAAFFNLNLHI